jgi:hypothetical protein
MTYYIHKQKTGVTIMKLYQKIARVASQKNWAKRSKELSLLQELLPNGNGIRGQEGLAVILLESTEKRIVIETTYWHPNDSYETSRCTAHQVVITPSFEGEINIRITGKNENNVKKYLHDIFREALMNEIVCNF